MRFCPVAAVAAVLALPALLTLAACGSPTVATLHPASSPQAGRMEWWREARFGMFIHWGLYAIPAGAWQGNTGHGEWIRDTARIPVGEYEKFQPQWNPVNFNADAWAQMAADAGMKYLVITSKHHDGFGLFDSKQTDWDAMNTPFGRDILAELSAACARHGVKFCTYHSIMDWHHPDYLPRRPWELAQRPVAGADFERFERYLHAQVTEVVQNYHPAVMWFDGEWESTWTHERGKRLFELCRSLAPQMIVNNRVDVHRGGMAGFSNSDQALGDFATPEQEIPATGVPGVDWESCMTMNAHWGWNQADRQWKSSTELLRNLIDIASKGGNYLLNIGPRADGTFPPDAVQRLAQIGAWMKQNGSAIHGTTASVFAALPFGRCTVKGERLYLHVFDWPQNGELVLPGLSSAVTRAFPLAHPGQTLNSRRQGSDVVIRVPAAAADPIATVIVVELASAPIVYREPTITAESSEFVSGVAATVASTSPGLEVHYTLDGSEPVADSPRAEGPVPVRATGPLRARAFHHGKAVTAVVERQFTTPVVTLGDRPGEHVALRFTGFLDVPQDELYRFALASDDGSSLWIDAVQVIDNDGLHGTVEKQGARALGQGLHTFEVIWFNRTGGAQLALRWALPGQPFAAVPGSALRH